MALATLGGGAIVAGGLFAMTIGPARLAVDTSKDGFLRRAGMPDAVRHAYLERALHRWTRYVQWLALPLAALGLMRTNGFARRVLAAWTALVIVGAPVGLLTGWFPADRLITFGFAIPALAGVGVVAVWLWLERRMWLATIVAVVFVGVMAAGALMSWSRQQPFIAPLEVDRATTAARIADTLPSGTPLVFIVDDDDATVSFLATRAANVIRASMPPDRVADVFIYVGTAANFLRGEPTVRGSVEYDAMSRLYLHDIPQDPAPPRSSWRRSTGRRTPRPIPRSSAGDGACIRPCPARPPRRAGRPAGAVLAGADRAHRVPPPGADGRRRVRVGSMGRPGRPGVGRRRARDRGGDARGRRRRTGTARATALGKRRPDDRRAARRRLRVCPARPAGQGPAPPSPSVEEQPAE